MPVPTLRQRRTMESRCISVRTGRIGTVDARSDQRVPSNTITIPGSPPQISGRGVGIHRFRHRRTTAVHGCVHALCRRPERAGRSICLVDPASQSGRTSRSWCTASPHESRRSSHRVDSSARALGAGGARCARCDQCAGSPGARSSRWCRTRAGDIPPRPT
jgi:hypothetical protein